MSKSEKVEITIPEDLQERLDALPNKANPVWRVWTPEMDAALLKYWPIKRHIDVAKALNISAGIALKRYRELMEA
jgi:hypothetical protein